MMQQTLIRLIAAILSLLGVVTAKTSLAEDVKLSFPQQLSMSPKGVNLQTGVFTYSKTDLEIGPLKFVRSIGDVPNFHIPAKVFGLHMLVDGKRGGWSHSFGQGLRPTTESNQGFLNIYVDGAAYKFTSNNSGVIYPWSKPTVGASFDGNVLTDKSGNRYTFQGYTGSPTAMVPLSTAEYANGHTLTYSYDASQRPRLISSNMGYAIVIDYNAAGNISAVCGFNTAVTYVDSSTTCTSATLKVTYSYDAAGDHLTGVTDQLNQTVTISGSFVHGGNRVIGPACITLPNSSTCEIQNFFGNQPDGTGAFCCDKPYEVGEQIAANGGKWLYNYEPAEDPADVPIVPGRPRWSGGDGSGPEGWNYSISHDRGVLVDVTDATGTYNYKYVERSGTSGLLTYDFHDTSPALVTYPDGHREYFTHDLRSNVKFRFVWPKGAPDPVSSVTGGPLIPSDPELARCCIPEDPPVVTGVNFLAAVYPIDYYKPGTAFPSGCGQGLADAKLCSSPTATFDFKANQTDYTYDPAHGGMLTKTLPAVQVNGTGPLIRPQTRYEYAQRYAWIKNVGGGFVQSLTPVWVKTRERTCKTTAASGQTCAGGATDEVITDFEYGPNSGPNNLLLRGVAVTAGGQTLRTCYAYDANGRKVGETQPNANLAVCP